MGNSLGAEVLRVDPVPFTSLIFSSIHIRARVVRPMPFSLVHLRNRAMQFLIHHAGVTRGTCARRLATLSHGTPLAGWMRTPPSVATMK